MATRNLDPNSPFAEWDEVDVTFPATPNTDVVVAHGLTPRNPDDIRYLPVRRSAAAHVYHDTSATRKAWQANYILLRSDVASVKVTLLVYVRSNSPVVTF